MYEKYKELALTQYNNGEITKEDLELKLKRLKRLEREPSKSEGEQSVFESEEKDESKNLNFENPFAGLDFSGVPDIDDDNLITIYSSYKLKNSDLESSKNTIEETFEKKYIDKEKA